LPLRIRSVLPLCLVLLLPGLRCWPDRCDDCDSYAPDFPDQTSPANDLKKLQTAYQRRDPIAYAELLADDFRFYFDPATRDEYNLPEFWTRLEDSTCTANLFASDEISELRLSVLEYDPAPEVVSEPGREAWRLIRVPDQKLEVDQKPRPGEPEGITYVIHGQRHDFYFRKGRSPGDTLASPSSQLWFIVEWRDSGRPLEAQVPDPAAVATTTWSELKVLFCQ
jgi:hypothetical protein